VEETNSACIWGALVTVLCSYNKNTNPVPVMMICVVIAEMCLFVKA